MEFRSLFSLSAMQTEGRVSTHCERLQCTTTIMHIHVKEFYKNVPYSASIALIIVGRDDNVTAKHVCL